MPGKLFKTIAAQGSATKEFFVPCTYGYGSGAVPAYYNCYPVMRLASNSDRAFINFRVSHDYNSIVVASIVVIPRVTQGAANWDTYSSYAQTGESYTAHTHGNAVTTYNVTNDQIFEINIADILTNLAANDIVGIKIVLSNTLHDVDVLGVRFKYS